MQEHGVYYLKDLRDILRLECSKKSSGSQLPAISLEINGHFYTTQERERESINLSF
jgi:hypothetical protein